MGKYSNQFGIYIGLLLTYSSEALFVLFFPMLAEEKGISLWLIGVFFALYPFASFMVSPIIGKYLSILGRKRVILAGYAFVSLSLYLLCPLSGLNTVSVIVLTLISRIFGGVGNSCLLVASTTIFVSDYPDQIQIMLGSINRNRVNIRANYRNFTYADKLFGYFLH